MIFNPPGTIIELVMFLGSAISQEFFPLGFWSTISPSLESSGTVDRYLHSAEKKKPWNLRAYATGSLMYPNFVHKI